MLGYKIDVQILIVCIVTKTKSKILQKKKQKLIHNNN